MKKEKECRIKNNDPDVQDFWKKVEQLQNDELLYTTFGPNGKYIIMKTPEGWELRGNDHSYYTGKDKLQYYEKIPTVGHLTWFLECTAPEIYARNMFSGQLDHMDNWRNLIKGFKLKKKESIDNPPKWMVA